MEVEEIAAHHPERARSGHGSRRRNLRQQQREPPDRPRHAHLVFDLRLVLPRGRGRALSIAVASAAELSTTARRLAGNTGPGRPFRQQPPGSTRPMGGRRPEPSGRRATSSGVAISSRPRSSGSRCAGHRGRAEQGPRRRFERERLARRKRLGGLGSLRRRGGRAARESPRKPYRRLQHDLQHLVEDGGGVERAGHVDSVWSCRSSPFSPRDELGSSAEVARNSS